MKQMLYHVINKRNREGRRRRSALYN